MYCDLGAETIQGRKLFKGGNYSGKYGILHVSQFKVSRVNSLTGLARNQVFGKYYSAQTVHKPLKNQLSKEDNRH